MADDRPPILLHGQFRCGSTYVFNKLRSRDEFCCYYEPLHHDLIDLRSDRIDLWGYDAGTTGKVNHPDLSKPHFYEYEACFHDAGILPYFDKSFSYDQYHKVEGTEFEKYINNLISSAPDGAQPVLQFNRSSMRIDWFADKIKNGRNVSLIRNPRDQFDSYVKVGGGVFLLINLIIITRSTPDNSLARLGREFLIPGFCADNIREEIKFYSKISKALSYDKHYKIFLSIWTEAYLHAIAYSDLVINMNRMGRDIDYRREIESYFGIPELFHDYDMKENTRNCMAASKLKHIEEDVFGELDERSLRAVRDFFPESVQSNANSINVADLISGIKGKLNIFLKEHTKTEKEKPPIISIVTPAYNHGQFIEETIQSVISQRGRFYIDYIIMDGLSGDATNDIVNSYLNVVNSGASNIINGLKYYKNEHIRCEGISFRFVSEKDSGQVNAINKGFEIAKGDILAWLNSDDIYYSYDTLASVVKKFANKRVNFMYGRGIRVDENGVYIREEMYVNNFKPAKIKHVDFILQPSAFWRRCVFEEIGDLNEELHYVFDWEYWIRIYEKYSLSKNDDILSCYRIHSSTKTNTGGEKRVLEIVNLLKYFNSYNGEARILNNLD